MTGDGFGTYALSPSNLPSDLTTSADSMRAAAADNSRLKLYLEAGASGVVALLGTLLLAIRRGAPTVIDSSVKQQRGIVLIGEPVRLWRSLSVDMLDINPWNAYLWIGIGSLAAAFQYCVTTVRRACQHEAERPQ